MGSELDFTEVRKLVYEPRIEGHGGGVKLGRTVVFDTHGDYICETSIRNPGSEARHYAEFKFDKEEVGTWQEYLNDMDIEDVSRTKRPGLNENILGVADEENIGEFRDNRYVEFEDPSVDVTLEEINSDGPAHLRVYNHGDQEEFLDSAAKYAAELGPTLGISELSRRGLMASALGNVTEEDLWRHVLTESFDASKHRAERLGAEL